MRGTFISYIGLYCMSLYSISQYYLLYNVPYIILLVYTIIIMCLEYNFTVLIFFKLNKKRQARQREIAGGESLGDAYRLCL